MKDLHLLPKFRDGWTYLYVDHCKVDRDQNAIVIHDERGRVPVPAASLAVLMLGPGTTVTHAAIQVLTDSGCLVYWTGEQGVRFYASGMGETRSSLNLMRQAILWADPERHMTVVRRLYETRFTEPLDPALTLQQIRGKEGARVRDGYAAASRTYGVPWTGRQYKRTAWQAADPVNRALSAANASLYGLCHAAIVSAGYSPALGFIHTGKMLSFVYDIADLYKMELTVPIAFRAAAEGSVKLESRVRHACRDLFEQERLLARIIPDIERILDVPLPPMVDPYDFDADDAAPGGLWDPSGEAVSGGVNFAEGEVVADDGDHSGEGSGGTER
ncbi:MAG: type I-E CRISPR-associated endonuclease Cas1e [Bacillota bacterium]